MLETGIIEASESSYRSNIFLVPNHLIKKGIKAQINEIAREKLVAAKLRANITTIRKLMRSTLRWATAYGYYEVDYNKSVKLKCGNSTQKIFTNTAIVIKLNDSCVIDNKWARREPLYDGFIIPDVDIFSSIRQIKSRHCIALVGAVWNSVTQLLLHLGHRRRERERGEEIQRLEREREAARIRSQQAISPAEPPASTDSEEPPLRKKRQAPETPTAPPRPTLPIYPPIRTSMF
ncbi:unnamed protein product [Trichogramma brassicae]|uniref:Uncharacterized protein n=1 Tax=Trichogramma brassicae TaxID=86971 RepID=A0A6H5J1W7_9HYME|nr:unnamed protein product [Trichogramma brassicae]